VHTSRNLYASSVEYGVKTKTVAEIGDTAPSEIQELYRALSGLRCQRAIGLMNPSGEPGFGKAACHPPEKANVAAFGRSDQRIDRPPAILAKRANVLLNH